MPFTLSHAAAALPLGRRPLVRAAVVAGTLAPDSVMVARLGPPYERTHSLAGVVTWDLLLALAGLAAWYVLLRKPLLRLLPRPLAARVPPVRRWSAGDLVWVPASAAVGAGSHVLWDSFTHARALRIWGWPWLGAEVAGIPVHQLLQWGSSAAGIAALAWWVLRRPPCGEATVDPLPVRQRASVLAVVAAVGLASAAASVLGAPSVGLLRITYEAVRGGMAGGVAALAGYAAAARLRSAER